MPRPCECDRCDARRPFRPERDCPKCWLWYTAEHFRKRYGHDGPAPQPPNDPRPVDRPPARGSVPATTTCRHLGAATGETRECPTCRGSVKLKLFACAVYGACTTAEPLPGVACCAGRDGRPCPSYAPKPP